MSNAPRFDPLKPTAQEAEAMLRGYRDGFGGTKKPSITDHAYDHGYRIGRNDRAGVVDDDQRELAFRALHEFRNFTKAIQK